MYAAQEYSSTVRPAAATASATKMQAIVHRQYGTPDVLHVEEIERPVPGDEDVLVRVHAAGANIGDHHVVTGRPYLIRLSPYGGLPRPKNLVPGATLAGRVEAVGAKVTTLRKGDEVYGQADNGAFAEYIVMPAKMLAPKPKNLTFEEAAAVPWGATALVGLRAGGVVAGHKVLIIGAAGGVGTWAVQIAKALGAHVTAVCSSRSIEMVRGLGADEVIDYTKEDFAAGGARFDVILDMVGDRTIADCQRALLPKGAYVSGAGGGGDWIGPFLRLGALLLKSLFTKQKLKSFMMTPDRNNLVALTELVEAGKAKPVIERTFPLHEAGAALTHVGEGHARGQTVIKIAS